jgi:hypothetical protein
VTPIINQLFERRKSAFVEVTAWDSIAAFVTTIDGTGQETGPLQVDWDFLCTRCSWNGTSGDVQLAKLLRWCTVHNRAFRLEFVRQYKRIKNVAGTITNPVPMELMRTYASCAFQDRNLEALRDLAPKNSIDGWGRALCTALEKEKIDTECKWLWPLIKEIVPNGMELCKKVIAALDEEFVMGEFADMITATGKEIAAGRGIEEAMGRKLKLLLEAKPEVLGVLKERWEWSDAKERYLTPGLREAWRRAVRTAAGNADIPKL